MNSKPKHKMEVSGHLHYPVPGEKALLSTQRKVSQAPEPKWT